MEIIHVFAILCLGLCQLALSLGLQGSIYQMPPFWHSKETPSNLLVSKICTDFTYLTRKSLILVITFSVSSLLGTVKKESIVTKFEDVPVKTLLWQAKTDCGLPSAHRKGKLNCWVMSQCDVRLPSYDDPVQLIDFICNNVTTQLILIWNHEERNY